MAIISIIQQSRGCFHYKNHAQILDNDGFVSVTTSTIMYVVKVLALVVCIDPVGVRVPAVAATKMDIAVTPQQKVV